MSLEIDLAVFTPREAEAITGVSTTMQRDWRRHGYLPSVEGHMRFNVFELAEMWAIKLLADRGIGPQQGKEVADWLGAGIVGFSLQSRIAFEGEHPDLEYMPDVASRANLAASREAAAEAVMPGNKYSLASAPLTWLSATNRLTRQVFRHYGKPKGIESVRPGRFFIWFADGSHIWHQSIDECFTEAESGDEVPQKLTGALAVLDQYALGRVLVQRANRPFVCVASYADGDE